jgi:REP element-mobilizing transposase RayT
MMPQTTRTFFVSSTTDGRRALLQSDRMAQLLVDVLAENRRKGRFLLHEFVIMPNHFHLLLTPGPDIPLEKALQFIKGGFSFRARREFQFPFENMARKFCQSSYSRRRGLQASSKLHLAESGQCGPERKTRTVCVVIGISARGIGRAATRAKESA